MGNTNEAEFETAVNLLNGITWNAAFARQFVNEMNGGALSLLRDAMAENDEERGNEEIVEIVREFIAKEYGPYGEGEDKPIAVLFETDEWDNGFYLDDRNATVFFTYGSHDKGVEISEVKDVLTETYGKVGPKAALGINLITGDIEYSESGADVLPLLGVKPDEHPHDYGDYSDVQ